MNAMTILEKFTEFSNNLNENGTIDEKLNPLEEAFSPLHSLRGPTLIAYVNSLEQDLKTFLIDEQQNSAGASQLVCGRLKMHIKEAKIERTLSPQKVDEIFDNNFYPPSTTVAAPQTSQAGIKQDTPPSKL